MPSALTIRLEDDTALALDRLAERTEQSHDWLVNQAVRDYLAVQSWQLERIAAGLAAADASAFVEDAEIERIAAKFAAIG